MVIDAILFMRQKLCFQNDSIYIFDERGKKELFKNTQIMKLGNVAILWIYKDHQNAKFGISTFFYVA